MAQITQIITIHDYNKMTDEQRTALGDENMLAVVQQDWEEARIQAAIAAMQGAINVIGSKERIARMCVELADALVAELQTED